MRTNICDHVRDLATLSCVLCVCDVIVRSDRAFKDMHTQYGEG